jgi:hypothetical protein
MNEAKPAPPPRPTASKRSRLLGGLAAVALASALELIGGSGIAQASRFGPPWQAEVTADQTSVYRQPDRGAAVVGPLAKGAVIPVLDRPGEWTRIPAGFVPTADTREKEDPWTAEVSAESVSVYAKPNAGGEVRRTAHRGDLLRVTGVSSGLEGDSSTWWATTEGYVPLDAITPADAANRWARGWTLPSADDATHGWWGEVTGPANVRAGATTEAPILGEFAGGEHVKVLGDEQDMDVGGNAKWYRIDGGRFAGARVHSSLIKRTEQPQPTVAPPPEGSESDRSSIVVVDRRAKTLTLLHDGQPQFVTYVALGKTGRETPAGGYGTFAKFRFDDMTSMSVPDAEHPYDLPNVPFGQYYKDGGFALHGTYWHDLFGTDQSQGCINLTWADAAYLFGQTKPEVASDAPERWVPQAEASTLVIVG